MKKIKSPNFDERGAAPIDILLLHYTGMETAEAALSRLCDAEAKVSAHYFIDEAGDITQLVPEDMRAWHAGQSFWSGERDINARSIGVELVNPGHEFGYQDFPQPQIEALIELAKDVLTRHDIPFFRVLGHSDVAPARKTDPGERFPWAKLARHNIGLWNEEIDIQVAAIDFAERVDRGFEVDSADETAFLESLSTLGYGLPEAQNPDLTTAKLIEAFQRHFNPIAINTAAQGKADPATTIIAESLATDLEFWINLRSS